MKDFKSIVARLPVVRRIFLSFLRKISKDITINHPYTKKPFKLNLYSHKGYWYYSKDRERESMAAFQRLINEGDVVIEVGGHIGFITAFYSQLVNEHGCVIVFEPGTNNLPYIRQNVALFKNVQLIEKGCADVNDRVLFFEDNITGQGNSIRPNYAGVAGVAKSHGHELKKYIHEIDVIRLDTFIDQLNIGISFIKIDVEGAEKEVLLGLGDYLGAIPKIMVEVTENNQFVFDLLESKGYEIWDKSCTRKLSEWTEAQGNVFAVLPSFPL